MLTDSDLAVENATSQLDHTTSARTALQQLQAETLEKMERLQLHPAHFRAIREILIQATENALSKIIHPS